MLRWLGIVSGYLCRLRIEVSQRGKLNLSSTGLLASKSVCVGLGITSKAEILPRPHGTLIEVDVGRSAYTVTEPKDGACPIIINCQSAQGNKVGLGRCFTP